MLSAFQARKWRIQPHNDVAGDCTSPSPPNADVPTPEITPGKRFSKRRPQNQDIIQDRDGKRVKKNKARGPAKPSRYFDIEDGLVTSESMIAIDANDNFSMSDLENGRLAQGPVRSVITEPRGWPPSQQFHDSSEDGSSELADQNRLDHAHPGVSDQPPVLSPFIPQPNVNTFQLSADEFSRASDANAAVLLVPATQTIALIGVYSLTVLKGSVSVCGVVLGPSTIAHRIFAPRSSPVPVLESRGSDIAQSGYLPGFLPERVRNVVTNQHAVLLLQDLRTGVEGLGRVIRIFERVFQPSASQTAQPTPYLGIPGVYMCSHKDRDVQAFILPNSWDTAISLVCPSSLREDDSTAKSLNPIICFIKGPKNSGKSTFARTLINRLTVKYRKVAFLDCDLGQSEFTPSGLISLNIISQPIFGQPFTHPTIPRASHFIGSLTPRNSPSHYLSAVQSLLQTYRLDIEYATDDSHHGDNRISDITPLVVNTMGWTKGLGGDLNNKIEEMIEPTDVFELGLPPVESVARSLAFPGNLLDINFKRLHALSAIATPVVSPRYTPADHRALSTLSYFHSSTLSSENENTFSQWDTSLPLCAKPPYEVDFKLAFDNVVLVMNGMEDIVAQEIQEVLNGAIVALVECMDELPPSETSEESAVQYTQGSPPPSPLASNCVGLGLVRSLSSKHMHIITPIPPHLLARCRVLVKGEVELPIWGMLDFMSENGDTVAGMENSKVPFLKWGKGEGLGGEKRRVRRNLMRRGQL